VIKETNLELQLSEDNYWGNDSVQVGAQCVGC
jgi:hypothetical protein